MDLWNLLWRMRTPRRRGRNRRRRNDRGFTLIEILVVITILGVLAAVVTPTVFRRVDQARQTKALLEIQQFSNALQQYAIDNGDYPTTEEGLRALAVQPEGLDTWQGPYLRGILDANGNVKPDPWGNPYVYVYPGEHQDLGFEFDLISYGKDGREGGTGFDADITNWGGILSETQ
ncbi:MAG: type II secretion system protein GspG [Candidatus Poribacteria bacterium]|nr:MAG: type II secretion system protein GspG [Candidatus Poribacteria bacterium]